MFAAPAPPPDSTTSGYSVPWTRNSMCRSASTLRAVASKVRMNSRPTILRFCSGSVTPASADRNCSSTLLTAKARDRCYDEVRKRALAWSVVAIEATECDRLGMHVANVEALRRALFRLDVRPSYVLTDGFGVDGLGVPG